MKSFMLVETRDPLETPEVEWLSELMAGLRNKDVHCSVMLTQNGVLGARSAAAAGFIARSAAQGIEILADEFALAERGISADELSPEVKVAGVVAIVDRLAAGDAVVWR